MCGGNLDACVESSSVITELTPELELVVTVDGRLFTVEDTGVEQVGGCDKEQIYITEVLQTSTHNIYSHGEIW